ncbi:MAG: N-acetylmuramoyl-L-alanine amidase [Clostridia bacterium]|nr:N-acetylmuramoyl-L-alanine amidase [Clostridia bacterium]
MKVIIDSGHGGSESGAVAFGLKEKDLNLIFSRLLAQKLKQMAIDVDESLINNDYHTPKMLTDLIKKSGAKLCISCHNNAFNGKARGLEVIHSIHSKGILSNMILEEVKKTNFTVRRAFSRPSTSPSGGGRDYYFIIRLTYPEVETIIVEFGFMDNMEDFKMLTDPAWQDRLTTAVAKGIKNYLFGIITDKTPIVGEALLTPYQLKKALKERNPQANPVIVDLYYRISKYYGIKADLAFLQSMHETNWLKYTGVVKPEQNNFAGLGATGGSNPGESFPSPETGIEAHIQHLFAYAAIQPVPPGRIVYDTRFNLVQRGIAPNWEDLNGKWAVPGVGYGDRIVSMRKNIMAVYPPGGPDDEETKDHWGKACNDELMKAGLLYNDHSYKLSLNATEGMVICLVNRLRKHLTESKGKAVSHESKNENIKITSLHWAKPCNDELIKAGILYNDHTLTLDSFASEAMIICLINRLRDKILDPARGSRDDGRANIRGARVNETWGQPCNDKLLSVGILENDHAATLNQFASEAMVLCLVNRLRKELMKHE